MSVIAEERPYTMAFFDVAIPKAAGSIIAEKQKGKKVMGHYCVFAPQELAIAAGAVPVALCATKEEPINDGEKVLPRNFCPLIKSSYGFAITDKCPFFLHSDLVMGETTCDGKKKMFELMGKFKPMHVMSLPAGSQSEADRNYWMAEMERAKGALEEFFQTTITDEALVEAIKELNAERQLMQRLAGYLKHDPVPLSGQDLLKVLWSRNFCFDRAAFAEQVEELMAELDERIAQGVGAAAKGAKRIIVTGVPTGVGTEKVIRIIEESGAAVVFLENCAGMKQFLVTVDETKPPMEAIGEKYLATPCSCMSPNTDRLELLVRLVDEYKADGIVDITWQGCHTYNVESRIVRDYLREQREIPVLHIETDYSEGDSQQIRTRVQAYLEMLGGV
ncbi:2-hydroxyacyl-CoA dehydratase [Heliobacterium undosum]|uniref:2-hydroxyacyl-CoA dehydratase n=1 Tax=Heliomicrobium undosum TaxID=121734 RepID=A0A845L529_9FIRM|nr:double-cubane-cluster-containing anaerobic reductase [Heliomicrobium undosum]MZP30329.1 2-hydroxyacyl-CoA dehydratase [Heliomicrobium undosum]